MANIYVGFHDQRSCNRILKPPGGGTSDIFGTDSPRVKKEEEKPVPKTPTKENDIKLVIQQSTPAPETDNKLETDVQQDDQEPTMENLSIAEENGEETEDKPSEAKTEIKPDTIGSIIRQDDKVQSPVLEPERKTPQRVPPGGYSSALW